MFRIPKLLSGVGAAVGIYSYILPNTLFVENLRKTNELDV